MLSTQNSWRPPPRLALLITRPVYFLIGVWVFHILLLAVGPIEYREQVRLRTWAVIAAALGVFWIGEAAANDVKLSPFSLISISRIRRTVVILGFLGVLGSCLLTFDKVLLSGLDFTQGLAAMRFERDYQVYAGIEIERSYLLYIGYPIFSLSYAAIMLFIMYAEEMRGWSALAGQLAILSPVFYALIYASRGNLLLLFYQIFGIMLVRWLMRKPMLPKAHGLRWKITSCALVFIMYSNFTWADRRSHTRMDRYETFIQVTWDSWQIRPSPWLHDMVSEETISPELAMNAVSYTHYYVHSFIMLNRFVEASNRMRPTYGLYQVGILSPIVRIFFPETELWQRMFDDLREARVLGFFLTAWGAMYMDWGLMGAITATFLWGLCSGLSYRATIVQRSPAGAMFLAALLGSAIVSPMNSPIGMSNSFQIFLAHALAAWMIKR